MAAWIKVLLLVLVAPLAMYLARIQMIVRCFLGIEFFPKPVKYGHFGPLIGRQALYANYVQQPGGDKKDNKGTYEPDEHRHLARLSHCGCQFAAIRMGGPNSSILSHGTWIPLWCVNPSRRRIPRGPRASLVIRSCSPERSATISATLPR